MALDPFRAFWRSSAAKAGEPSAWVDLHTGEEAPYALSTGEQAIAILVGGADAPSQPLSVTSDYYASILLLLAQMAERERKATSKAEMR